MTRLRNSPGMNPVLRPTTRRRSIR
jgi:hypothetical protein